jgi:glucosamine-6-phosphate deaminase
MDAAVEIHATPEALGEALAADALAALRADRLEERTVLLGCPSGRSLQTTYRAMGSQAARDGIDLSRLVVVMMDEYLVSSGAGLTLCDTGAHYSCLRFAHEHIRETISRGLPPRKQIAPENVWIPDPAEPQAYDARITEAGGISLFLLASGSSDGHVAFNPPGTPRRSVTRVVALPSTTRTDNMESFPDFRSLEEVPTHGVSVGVATIAELSRRAVLVMRGADKRLAAARVTGARSYEPAWPATIIHECRRGRILLDRAAADGLALN